MTIDPSVLIGGLIAIQTYVLNRIRPVIEKNTKVTEKLEGAVNNLSKRLGQSAEE